MSQILIQQYLNHLQDLLRVSGTSRESVVREAFKDLLKGYARAHDLIFIAEYEIETPARERRYVDGALLYSLRVPFGYWEAKDQKDDLDAEIELKFRRGYPQDNIIFEDSREAVLIQNRQEVMRCPVEEPAALERLLALFFAWQRPEIGQFRKAVEQFRTDLPAVLQGLREMIETAELENTAFRDAGREFLEHAQEVINPSLTEADVREMLIQHILTEDVFAAVFPGTPFHQDNNVARELYQLEATFFTGNTKYRTLKALEPYYAAIRAAAAQIASHHEKQTFLKVIYENFYKVYNVKAADRLGVVYTPNEIVRFMIESADWLCEKHFGRNLIDPDVEILDPATGTGTFICELLEYFRGQPARLTHKYREELHANEVAILPYYVANLNIEATYAAITGEYAEFPNLCFVDTLDNLTNAMVPGGLTANLSLLGTVSEENIARIRRQNSKKISVIIGNPPYNAWQGNFNLRNPNRPYQQVDERIRGTYQAAGTAQNKIALYDMYVRFFRWASDRLAENGALVFVSNRSFVDSRSFDGFRKIVADEFSEVWLVDLGGDVRENPKLSGTRHNVFGIQTGITVSFLVKRVKSRGCRIFYARRPELETAEEKLAFLGNAKLQTLTVEEIRPDARHDWIDQTHNDFDSLLPLISKEAKIAQAKNSEQALFKLFSMGIKTQRDEWVYDFSRAGLERKMRFFVEGYEKARHGNGPHDDTSIKWDHDLDKYRARNIEKSFEEKAIVTSLYRPFCKRFFYFDRHFNGRVYQWMSILPDVESENRLILYTQPGSQKPFMVGAAATVCDLHYVGAAAATECLPFYRYDHAGNRVENITDGMLDRFRKRYGELPHPNLLPPGEGTGSTGFAVVGEGTGNSLSQRERAGVRGRESAGVTEDKLFNPPPLPERLLANARALRKGQTNAEQLLWKLLRNRSLGVKFRRQHPVGDYILDFYCADRRLGIELDGGQHGEDDVRDYDQVRSAALEGEGVRVLRFWNNEVLGNLEGVWVRIVEALEEPSPRPSPVGRGSMEQPSPAGRGSMEQASPAGRGGISTEAIFHYVYAVLHDPVYREKYALNLKREFPRIPFYPDFWQWAGWGEALMGLHIGYESVEPWALKRSDVPDEKARTAGIAPKMLLKADKEGGRILIDSETTLAGVPPEAWDYRLGNRCALEWILDQYKEKKPKDPTIRAHFNTYRFADYKEQVIDLLMRVTRVSVETQKIVEAMRKTLH